MIYRSCHFSIFGVAPLIIAVGETVDERRKSVSLCTEVRRLDSERPGEYISLDKHVTHGPSDVPAFEQDDDVAWRSTEGCIGVAKCFDLLFADDSSFIVVGFRYWNRL